MPDPNHDFVLPGSEAAKQFGCTCSGQVGELDIDCPLGPTHAVPDDYDAGQDEGREADRV